MPIRRHLAGLLPAAALFVAFLASAASPAAGPDHKIVAEMTRYLKAIQFGETFLGGVRKTNSAEGQGSAFLDRLLMASPEQIEATVAPAFAGHVTLKEARAIADFFTSPLGQKAFAQGRKQANDRSPASELSAAETRELEKFAETPAGQLAVTLPTDPAIRQEYFVLLKAKYGQ